MVVPTAALRGALEPQIRDGLEVLGQYQHQITLQVVVEVLALWAQLVPLVRAVMAGLGFLHL